MNIEKTLKKLAESLMNLLGDYLKYFEEAFSAFSGKTQREYPSKNNMDVKNHISVSTRSISGVTNND